MEYFVVEETSSEDLAEMVNEMLQEGWKLQGGVSVAFDRAYRYFCQALIKE